jgi:ATP-binding cassette subfamily B protein
LIFAQATADLKLPDMMSDIVNNGIQNGGIESPTLAVLSEDTYSKILNGYILNGDDGYIAGYGENGERIPLLTDKEYDAVARNYMRVKMSILPNSVKVSEDLSDKEKEDIYVDVRNDILGDKKVDDDALNSAMEKSFVFFFSADMIRTALIAENDETTDENIIATVNAAKALINAFPFGAAFLGDLKDTDLLTLLERAEYSGLKPIFLSAFPAPKEDGTTTKQTGFIPMIYSSLIGTEFSESMAILQARTEIAKAGLDPQKTQSAYILNKGLLMLLIALGSAACAVVVGYLAALIAAKFARDIRRNLFEKVESFSNHEIDKFTTASIITRSTNDVTQIQQLVMMMIKLIFYAPMMGLGAIWYVGTKAPWELTFLDVLAVTILVLMVFLLFIFALPRFKLVQKLIDKLNLIIRENLSGMTVIRAFNKQKKEAERFDAANKDLTKVNLFINRLMVMLMPAMTLLMSGLTIAIMWIGSDMIVDNRLKVGDLMAFIQYAMQIVMSFLMISVMFIMIPRASVGAKRISDVLETDPIIKDDGKASLNGKAKGRLSFEKVGFKYEGAEVDALTDVSFTAEPNKVFAIIGTTGAGKSTVVNLIPRFYDVSEGRITLDGIDIRELSLKELRDNVAIVAQKSLLFSGTVASNLALANSAADGAAMYAALETAQIKDFVEGSEGGLDKSIAQGGQNVSGGQKQRLSIARALVKDAPVLVFDDSFSALDFKTDAKLRKALKLNIRDKAIIIVAQRIGTIKDADEILVLDEGRTAGIGNHKYLMENCEAYREIAFSQLSKEELL